MAAWNPAWQAQFAAVQNINEAMYNAMTPDQKMQIQQNWQQWQAYQEQYAQWHAQYGEQYEKEMQKQKPAQTQPAQQLRYHPYKQVQQVQQTQQQVMMAQMQASQSAYAGYQQTVAYQTPSLAMYQVQAASIPQVPMGMAQPPPPPPPPEAEPPPPPPPMEHKQPHGPQPLMGQSFGGQFSQNVQQDWLKGPRQQWNAKNQRQNQAPGGRNNPNQRNPNQQNQFNQGRNQQNQFGQGKNQFAQGKNQQNQFGQKNNKQQQSQFGQAKNQQNQFKQGRNQQNPQNQFATNQRNPRGPPGLMDNFQQNQQNFGQFNQRQQNFGQNQQRNQRDSWQQNRQNWSNQGSQQQNRQSWSNQGNQQQKKQSWSDQGYDDYEQEEDYEEEYYEDQLNVANAQQKSSDDKFYEDNFDDCPQGSSQLPESADKSPQKEPEAKEPAKAVASGSQVVDEDELRFDEQFKKWEEQFFNWKQQNVNHPDRRAYREYEMKFEECRNNLLERREQMRRRKAKEKMEKMEKTKDQEVLKADQQQEAEKPQESTESQEADEMQDVRKEEPQRDENLQNLFNSSTSKSIPGLDFLSEEAKNVPESDEKVDAVANRGADLAEISKNITSLLQTSNLMNILSMVKGSGKENAPQDSPNQCDNNNARHQENVEQWNDSEDPWAEREAERFGGFQGQRDFGRRFNDDRDRGYQDNFHGQNEGRFRDNFRQNDAGFRGNFGQNDRRFADQYGMNDRFGDRGRMFDDYAQGRRFQDFDRGMNRPEEENLSQHSGGNWRDRRYDYADRMNDFDNSHSSFSNHNIDDSTDFRPAQVIDYTNMPRESVQEPLNSRKAFDDILIPAKVVDYGHKKTSDSTPSLGNRREDFVLNMTTIDYGHASKDNKGKKGKPEVAKFHRSKKDLKKIQRETIIEAAKKRRKQRVEKLTEIFSSTAEYPGKWTLIGERQPFPDFPTKRGARKTRSGKKQLPKEQRRELAKKAAEMNKLENAYEGISDDEDDDELEMQKDEMEIIDLDDESLPDVDEVQGVQGVQEVKQEDEMSDASLPDAGEFDFPDAEQFLREQELKRKAKESAAKEEKLPVEEKTPFVVAIKEILEQPHRKVRPKRICVIFRGPPGSGKTYFAKLIKDREVEFGGSAPRILSIDDYYMTEVDEKMLCPETNKPIEVKKLIYTFEEGVEEQYMQYLLKSYRKTITDGYFDFIIVDCVNKDLGKYQDFVNFGKVNGFTVFTCEMILDAETCFQRNTHGRKRAEIEEILDKWPSLPADVVRISQKSLEVLHQEAEERRMQTEQVTEEQFSVSSEWNEDEDEEEEETEKDENDTIDEASEFGLLKSKWDSDRTEEQLARLDGTSKPLRHTTMEDFLQDADDLMVFDKDSKPGQKRVRWADIEERRAQEKMRAIGFVVGQTDWSRMMDPTQGSSALTQTKYIERHPK
ncbi:trichohyalin [Phlebotomus argentipes]|uniref:trichohyalin n=1 Tax=Phlebotomus argentipes TaxID=94469 RepID=UPI0028936819|nr:trichohyalin [Phlebotomus argentipes]